MRPATLFFIGFVGCGSSVLGVNPPKDDTGSAGSGGGIGGGSGGGSGGGGETSVNPKVTSAQAICETGFDETWYFTAGASDPQGIETIESGGLLEVFDGETLTKELGVVCSASTGFCSGEFSSSVVDVPCYQAADYDFHFTVFDEDGNRSEAFSVSGSSS
jgi:hypothetical protein